jgi:DNA mismatch repair protein MutS2
VRDLRVAVRSARKELDDMRARIRSTAADPGLLRELERGVSQVAARVALGGEFEAHARSAPSVDTVELSASDLRVGQTVKHRTLGTTGQVIELCTRDRVRLMIGAMKLLVPIRELSVVANRDQPKGVRSKPKYEPATVPKLALTAQRSEATTLDLRGQRFEEALSRVDGFIDRLLGINEMAGFVLHGHGTGALKSGVREHLRASAYVEHSRPAEANEGGDAFTVFWLRG